MTAVVVDTHTIVWAMVEPELLSEPAIQAFSSATRVFVPSICLVEVVYLVEKGRLDRRVEALLFSRLSNPRSGLIEAPLTLKVIRCLTQVPRREVPDMPDRIIAATSLRLRKPLITRDRRIRACLKATIW